MGCNFYPMRFRVLVYIPAIIANGYGFMRAVHGETRFFQTRWEKNNIIVVINNNRSDDCTREGR